MPLLKQTAGILSSEQTVSPPASLAPSLLQIADYLVDLIMQGLKVSNDGRSYTIHIAFASPTLISPQPSPTLMQGNIWRTRST